jgi:hypothetical protein
VADDLAQYQPYLIGPFRAYPAAMAEPPRSIGNGGKLAVDPE